MDTRWLRRPIARAKQKTGDPLRARSCLVRIGVARWVDRAWTLHENQVLGTARMTNDLERTNAIIRSMMLAWPSAKAPVTPLNAQASASSMILAIANIDHCLAKQARTCAL